MANIVFVSGKESDLIARKQQNCFGCLSVLF